MARKSAETKDLTTGDTKVHRGFARWDFRWNDSRLAFYPCYQMLILSIRPLPSLIQSFKNRTAKMLRRTPLLFVMRSPLCSGEKGFPVCSCVPAVDPTFGRIGITLQHLAMVSHQEHSAA
jgi:hypothetical protein